MEPRLKHSVMHSFKWMAMARLTAQVMRWAVTLIVIRILSPADFGIVALAETVIGFLEFFAAMGLGAAIIRDQKITQEQLRSIFTLVLIVDCLLFLVLFLGAPAVAEFYQQPALVLVLRVLGCGFLISALETIPSALLAKEMKFKQLAIIQLSAGVVGAATSLTLALLGFGYWALVWGGLSIQLARGVGVCIARGGLMIPGGHLRSALHLASFGGMVLGANLVWYLYVSLDLIIAGRFWDAPTLGIYAVALQLAAMPLSKIMPMMKQIALPAYSKTQTDRDSSRYYLVKSLRLSMGIGLPFFFGLAAISTLLVPLLFDIKWEESAMPLMLLFLAMPFRMFLELHEPAVTAGGRPQLILRNSLIILCIMAPAFFYAARMNPTALALVWLCLFPPLALAASYTYCRLLDIRYTSLLGHIAPAFLISAVMFIGLRFGIHVMTPLAPPLVNIVLAIVAGVVFYLGSIALFDRAMFQEYLGLLRR